MEPGETDFEFDVIAWCPTIPRAEWERQAREAFEAWLMGELTDHYCKRGEHGRQSITAVADSDALERGAVAGLVAYEDCPSCGLVFHQQTRGTIEDNLEGGEDIGKRVHVSSFVMAATDVVNVDVKAWTQAIADDRK